MTRSSASPLLATLLLLGLALAAAGCSTSEAGEPGFRHATPRGGVSIFSPLDLPAPNLMRTGSGAPGPAYWQQRADYAIEAELDPVTRILRGRERITYTNASPDALDYLWIHLEQNVFRADSIGAAVGGRTAVGMDAPAGDGVTLHELLCGGRPLSWSVFDTLARIDLPEPLAPGGGVLELEIAWSFTVPENVFRRFGIEHVEQGTIFEIAQWFPALAVYDDVHGWNTLPYIGTGEFYTDFGDYDVRLTVPRDQIVVATGALQNPEEVFTPEQVRRLERAKDSSETVFIRSPGEVDDPRSRPAGRGPVTWHFRAERVRTFAWAASDAFILDAASLDGILLQSAYPKEALPLWTKSTQMLRTAIRGYSERWFPYPYPAATNVNGPEGGMEYPMIVFCGAREREASLYGVTTHEIGHMWFPMIVNTDERRHAWMDEGFNTFINDASRAEWPGVGPSGRMDPEAQVAFMQDPDMLPIETAADLLPRRLLGMLEYGKTAYGLKLLREEILGPERFDFAFRTYIRRWAWKSPRPADFFRTMEDASGADLAWFWRGWFLETALLDQAVAEVVQPGEDGTALIVFENRAGLVMPLTYRITWEDGERRTVHLPVEVWYGSDRLEEPVQDARRIVAVAVDPDRRLPDVDRDNDAWPR